MVSVIIPVYNVCEYLDKCIESIVNQTFRDLEIILINDGSSDGSDKKCEIWEKKDKRIRYISQENKGLGPVRNLGIELSRSEYIMFVDSDDWVDVTIVEKLLDRLKKTDSDIAVCDRYEVKLEDFSLKLVTNETTEEVIEAEQIPSNIPLITTSSWAKLYKKSLFTDYNIKQPGHCYEDVTTPVLLALSKRVCYVKEALYYYVTDRGGSITNDITSLDQLSDYLKTMVELFQRCGLFERYNACILEICRRRVSWNLYHASQVLNHTMWNIYLQNTEFLKKYWGKEGVKCLEVLLNLEKKFCSWGSYNLMIAMKILMRMDTASPPAGHYAFSGLIGAMDKNSNLNEVEIEHKNQFRKSQLLKEFKREFANKNTGEFSDIEYFVLDFLEERFDTGIYKGHYVTISDAFVDLAESKNLMYEKCKAIETSTERKWEESCLQFIALIRKYMKGKTIVLVKMKLAQKYGDQNKKVMFENQCKIKRINQRLDKYYDFFSLNCPEALCVEVENSTLYYTDKNFKHGCYPWHLNSYMYLEIRDRIKEAIWRKK